MQGAVQGAGWQRALQLSLRWGIQLLPSASILQQQAMAQEMEEQAPRLEALQLRAEDTEAGLRGAARGTAKLAGSAPRRSAATTADQAAAQAAARLRAAAAPVQ